MALTLTVAATVAATTVATPAAWAEEPEGQADIHVVDTTVIPLDATSHDIVVGEGHGRVYVSDADTAPPPVGGQFFDDDNNIFENDIEAIAAAGVTKGCNPPFGTGFCPNDFITRAQMAAFLVRALGYTDSGGGDLFVDDDGSTFEDDLDRLGTAGVTQGCNPPANDRFCPDDFVTRGQMAAFLVRALGYTDTVGDLFIDDDGSTFENDINRLATAGVTTGCNPPDNTRFCPDDFVTRGQMAAFLTRALELSRPSVADRPETTNGFELNVVGAAVERGCSFSDGETCHIRQSPDGEFFLLTGWFYGDWSSLPSSIRANFESDSVRVEANFDGVPIDLVEFPLEVIDNVAYKSYTFQFPAWLDGDHILEVRFIDDAESYLLTIRDELSLSGDGYPLTTGSLSTTSSTSPAGETQWRPNRSNHWAPTD